VRLGAMLADFNQGSERKDEDDSGLAAIAR